MTISQAKVLAQEESGYGQIIKQVLATSLDNRELIVEKFPRLNRFLTGYDLENVLQARNSEAGELNTFDLSRLITGSEGSLAFVCQAKLNITPISPAKTLINI